MQEQEEKKYVGLYVLKTIEYENTTSFKKPDLNRLSRQFDKVCYYDSNKDQASAQSVKYSGLLAIGASEELIIKTPHDSLNNLQRFCDKNPGWKFGALSYELKNEIEDLSSENLDLINFPVLHFFVPEVVIEIFTTKHILHFDDKYLTEQTAGEIYTLAFPAEYLVNEPAQPISIQNRISKAQYFTAFENLKKHISRGDIYEINFCQEFYAENITVNPAAVFTKLNNISKAPFAAFCKLNEHFIISSSPERFLKKDGNTLMSQPIKGTIKRSSDIQEDERLKNTLKNDKKEQNENVMIVDLVRNDLSRIAVSGSVMVPELFGIHTFLQVHHMISTVSCEIPATLKLSDIIRATFPMGSMTGAPKVSALKLIEEFETTKRGIYSGAIGYITPNGDFDFSVVIRSILYNSSNKYLSFITGSAITSGAEAENEYNECLLKANAMIAVLQDTSVRS